jgi:hypothetical protein
MPRTSGSSNLNPEIACRRSRLQGGSGSRFSLFLSHVVTKNIMNRKTPLLIAVLASAAVSAHAQNLVLNPGFETGDFTDWTPSGCQVTTLMVHSGTFAAEFGRTPCMDACTGNLDQTITTVAGQLYHVDFWLANMNSLFDQNEFFASFAGVTIASLADSSTFGYTHFSGFGRATSTSSVLHFLGTHFHPHHPFDNAGRWYLDDVSVTAEGAPAFQLSAAVSRKTHGAAGDFDIDLPLAGEPGVECRSGGAGGNHTFVFTFTNNVVSGNATVTSGIGTVSGPPIFSNSTMTVNLTGAADVQRIIVTLTGVTDSFGQVLPDTAVSADMLIGDATGNRTVNSSDIAQVKAQAGLPVDVTNFREDVTVDGVINASDIGLVKSKSGDSLPP